MKFSKAQILAKVHKIPTIRFEDQRLTSFSGLVIFQALFSNMQLKKRLGSCLENLTLSPIFGRHLIVMLLIVHLLLGFRRLREMDYYRDDPMVLRLLGLRNLPDVSTVSRALSQREIKRVENLRSLCRELVLEDLHREDFPHLTFDFDGSVLSTKGHAEGTAVGFNGKRKGSRSYYPLFCTVAQTLQFFDFLLRPGNVHDSNCAIEFMSDCFERARQEFPRAQFETRTDAAFLDKKIFSVLDRYHVKFTASVPFERLVELKGMVEGRKRWRLIDSEWSYFETTWKPKSWKKSCRFIFVRRRVKRQIRGPLQLDLTLAYVWGSLWFSHS